MYFQYYGLQRAPFELTPDPDFFYPTRHHNEALAMLWHGVLQRKGFIVVTGEVGTGKTLLVRYLLLALTSEKIQFSYVFNPRLAATEFLQYVLADFDHELLHGPKSEQLWKLNQWLINAWKLGKTAVLLVDEAHLLEWDVLEEIRLLTNLETNTQKLLQIVLVGQPELDEKLDSPSLRQLKQRIAFRAKLRPLEEADTLAYIRERLHKSGLQQSSSLFPDATCRTVHRLSRGIPRIVNCLCEHALIMGFARQVRVIRPQMIETVAQELGLVAENAAMAAIPQDTD
jgi:general secretion pathway protein A